MGTRTSSRPESCVLVVVVRITVLLAARTLEIRAVKTRPTASEFGTARLRAVFQHG
jgi:hypothetical protein